ncbi:MAG: hypothetical protein GY856_39510 [bacterium]|nr:hypothetical protein [bacterium]
MTHWMRRSGRVIAAAVLALAPLSWNHAVRAESSTARPGSLTPAIDDLAFARDPRPKTFVTDFTWYHPNEHPNGSAHPHSLACTLATPRRAFGEIASADYLSSGGYYAEKYQRFRRRGVDGIAFLVTDRIPDSFAGGNLVQVAGLAADAGMEFFAYYDLYVTTAKLSDLVLCLPGGRCRPAGGKKGIPSYNINTRPEIYAQLLEGFQQIGEYLILPYLDSGYSMLEDASGRRVLDETGLPRPIITIYIARTFSDKPANLRKLGELMDEITENYRNMGIGKPAVVLDVVFWVTPSADDLESTFDPDIVEAFGDHAVAITWYGFFDAYRGALANIYNDGRRSPMSVWAKKLNQQYRKAREELQEHGLPLMIWPGVQTQIDTRVADVEGCSQRDVEIVYHLRDAEDWRTMFRKGVLNAWRPAVAGDEPLQTVVLVSNAGEWFEIGAVDYTHRDRYGECSFPYNWCTALLDVIQEEDRY